LLPLRMEKRGLSRRFLWHLIVNIHILALVNHIRILMLRSQLTQIRLGYGPDRMYGDIDMDTQLGQKGSGSSEGHRYRKMRSDASDEEPSSSSRGKKRARYPGSQEHSNDDTPIPVPVQKTRKLTIGDSAKVEEFYTSRFRDMQQSSCKVMGKAFMKLVEPKKQTYHPYIKGIVMLRHGGP